MTEVHYKEKLKNQLTALSMSGHACFAAACATRMVNACRLVSSLESTENNLSHLEHALDFAWNAIEKNDFDKNELKRLLDQTNKIWRVEKASRTSRFAYYRADAAAAVAYALENLPPPKPSTLLTMANYNSLHCALKAIDTALLYCKLKSNSTLSSELFKMPPLKIEWERQTRDLTELTAGYSPSLGAAIKARAEKEATLFNGDIPSNKLPPDISTLF